MQLTNSALSMLLKRYRAVLFKCRTLNWLGGTVLAAGLVLGAASGALAEDVVWTKNADVTATNVANDSLTIKTGTDFVIDGTKTPGGINLTVSDGAQITVNGSGKWYQTSLFGYSAAADANDAAAVPTTFTGAGTQITVTKGSVGAGLPGDGTGAGPYAFTISDGAKVILNGAGKDEAVILAYATQANQMVTTISGANTIVEVAASKYGTIDTPYGNVSVTNGAKVDAQGTLDLIAGGLPQTADGAYDAANASTAQFSVNKGGRLTVAESTGALTLHKGVTLTVAADGVLENKGVIKVGVAGSENATLDVSALADPLAALSVGDSDTKGQVVVAGVGEGQYSKLVVGDLTIAAADLVKTATADKIALGAYGSLQAQNLTLEGASLAIDANGRINVEQLTLTDDLTVASGLIRLRGETNSALNGNLTLDATGAASTAELRLGAADDATQAKSFGGTLNGNVTATKGTVAVNSGTWTLATDKTLDIQAGSVLTVGGDGDLGATLVVNGTLKSAEAGDGSAAGINVLDNGVLKADKSKLLKDPTNTSTAIADNLSKIWLANGSTLQIGGYETITGEQMKSNSSALVAGGSGLISYGDAKITAPAGGWTDNAAGDGSASNVGSILPDATVTVDASGVSSADLTQTVNGGYGAQDIAIDVNAATKNVEVTTTKDLTLLGNDSGQLISTGDATLKSVTVGNNAALNLGYAGQENKDATLGAEGNAADVELGTNSSLTATGAEYTVGAVDGGTAGEGTVKAIQGSTLNVASIGATTAVDEVQTVGGALVSEGVITTNGDLDANGGSVTAGDALTVGGNFIVDNSATVEVKSIAVTGTTQLSGATVKATDGSITLGNTVDATEGASAVTAEGDISVTGAVSTAEGATLAMTATGGDITATANVQATSLVATAGDDPAKGNISAATKNIEAPVVTASNGIAVAALTADGSTVTQGATVSAKQLTATGAVAVSDGTLTLTSTKTDNTEKSTAESLTLTNVTATVAGQLEVTNATAVSGGTLTANEVTATGGATFVNGANASIATLTTTNDNIQVGTGDDEQGGTTLVVNVLELNNKALLVDPAWGLDSSVAIVNSFGTAPGADVITTGDIAVGQNAMLAYGPDASKAWLDEQVAAAVPGGMLSKGGVESVLALQEPLTIANDAGHKILLAGDGATGAALGTALAGATETFTQQANTLLIVDGAADGVSYTGNAKATDALPAGVTGAISATTAGATADIAAGAKLHIAGAEVGKTYVVLGENITTTYGDDTAWSGANLTTDNPLVTASLLEGAEAGQVGARLNSAANVMPKLDSELVDAINAAAVAHQIGVTPQFTDSPEKGVRFLSRAIAPDYLDAAANPDLAAQTIEGAARMVTIGAVPQMTRAANQAAGEAVTQRTSLAQPTGIQTQEAGDHFALWIMPLYQSVNGFGMEAGNFDADFNGGLGGVAIGADYTFANAIRAGITFNIGGGYATGGGDFADTTNSMNFWGIGAYAGWTKNNFGLSADVNFTSAYNKLEQDLPAAMDMRDLKADVRSYAFSTGLRGEYKLETDVLDIIPHVGVRYMYLSTEDYKVKSEGTVLKGDGLNQNIWTFPVGVSFSKSIDTGNGWHFKPMVDLSVIPAAGDIKARENVRFTGTDTQAELETQIMDYISYQGGLGFEVGNENLAFGVNGNVQFGAKTSGYGVLGTFRYEF